VADRLLQMEDGRLWDAERPPEGAGLR
jgi:hypothetical protein